MAAALRSELAGELGLDAELLANVEPEVAGAVLAELSELTGRLHGHPALAGPDEALRDPHEAGRRDLFARTLRDHLAAELGVEPRRLSQLSPLVAAHTLLHLREKRRELEEGIEVTRGPDEDVQGTRQDRRDVLGRVVRESLALQLGLEPALLRGLTLEQAAAVLVRLMVIRERIRELESQVQSAPVPQERVERRDVVARALRTVIADQLGVHPRVLGGLSPLGAARMLTHVSSTRSALARMQTQVAVDELTGALRRAAGEARLEQEMRRANRLAGGRLIIVFLDMDALKTVNDTSGHAAGDRLLRDLVSTLRARLRSYDAVIRWGGDEFVCILPQTGAEAAEKVFSEVLDSFRSHTGQRFSAGFAALEEGDGIPELVARADRDLYDRRAARHDGHLATVPAPKPQPRPGALDRVRNFLLGR